MSQCVFSHQAQLDLFEIRNFVALVCPDTANRIIDFFEQRCPFLVSHPEFGEQSNGLAVNLRFIRFGLYVLFYRSSAKRIEVVRVIRGGREIEAVFRQ